MKRIRGLSVSFLACLLAAACSDVPAADRSALTDDAVTVASFNFPESVLLAEIYAQAMESAGYRVERELGLGTRELVIPALAGGLVEFVPEYTGSGLDFLAGTEAATSDRDFTYRALAQHLQPLRVVVLDAARAQDQNGFAVTAETADRFGLTTLSDLAAVSSQLTFGGPPECVDRPRCLPGLDSRYGIAFEAVVELDSGGPLTLSALVQGTVDVALLFTTDGAIDRNDLVLLRDDQELQPVEHVTPVIRAETVSRLGPGIEQVVNSVSAVLTTDELRGLNAEVSLGHDPRAVAAAWLDANGLGGVPR
ncbi:MAG TPA: ABC transporter substrate-binding protein [Actinomycetota bacterium]|nr:ABC transporter substrate-binding protein [Actinomycetota bacterium]